MNPPRRPLLQFAVLLAGLTFPLHAVVTAVDDGSTGSPFFSATASQGTFVPSVIANDTDAGDVVGVSNITGTQISVRLLANGQGLYNASKSGAAAALAPGSTSEESFDYTVTSPATGGATFVLNASAGIDSFPWGTLPALVAASGTNLPSGITQAYGFSGTGADRVAFTTGTYNTKDATFEFWLRPDAVDTRQVIFETGGSGTGSGVYINADGTVSFLSKGGSNPFVQSTATLTAGNWHHIVITYDVNSGGTSSYNLYIDKVLEGNATSANNANWSGTDGAGLGAKSGTSAGDFVDIDSEAGNQTYGGFSGQIGLVRFYSLKILDATEVTANFDAATSDSATVTVQISGANDAPEAHGDYAEVLEDATLTSTGSLVANDGPVRYQTPPATLTPILDYDAGVAGDGTTWPNIGSLSALGGELSLSNATLDTDPVSSRPGITAAIDFDDTTGGSGAMLVGAPGVTGSVESFGTGIDTTDATFECWVRLNANDLTQTSTLFETGGGSGFGVIVNNGVLEAAAELDGETQVESWISYDLTTDTLNTLVGTATSEFNQIVVTIDTSGGLEMFVNGTSVANSGGTGVTGDWSGSDPAGVGKFKGSNHGGFKNSAAGTYDAEFKGEMAIVRLYSGILTPAEITDAYNRVAATPSDILYLNYDASVDVSASTWPNLGSLNTTGTSGGDLNLTGVTLDEAPGSAFPGITSALDFNDASGGSGAMAVISANNGINEFPGVDTADLSLEFWVKLDDNDLTQISTLFETGGGSGFGIVVDNGVIKGAVGYGEAEVTYDLQADSLSLLATPTDPTAEFFQVVMAIDFVNKGTLLYVNGTLVDTATGITITDLDGGDAAGVGHFGESNHGGFTGGAASTDYNTFFRGSMAIFRLYGATLTEAQARQNYEAVAAGTDVDGDNLAVTGIYDSVDTLQGIASPATLASGATVTLDSASGAFTYDPNGAFDPLTYGTSSVDIFTYQVSDGNGATATAEVEVTVHGRPDNLQPVATNTTQTVSYTAGATNVPIVPAIVTSDGNDGIVTTVDAEFLWDGTETTFPGGASADDNDFASPALNNDAGFALNLAFVPTTADVQVGTTRALYQIGGTSNGHGIYLYNGIPHLLVKMQGVNESIPTGLNDTDWSGSVVSIPLTASAVTVGEATDIALIFSLDQVDFTIDGGALQSVALTNRGAKNNWYGNLSTTIGLAGTSGSTGGTSTTDGLFIYSSLTDLEGPVTSCRLWNNSTVGTSIIDPDILTVTLTMNSSEGALSVPTGASFDGTTWTYVGTPAQVNASLSALEFLPNGTTPVDVTVDIRDGEEDGAVPVTGTLTFEISSASALEAWRDANGLALDGSEDELDGDSDGLVNILEFGFGTDVGASDNGTLNPDGSVNGTPTLQSSGGGGGITFNAIFNRRDDAGLAGSVNYTVQFSADLVTFHDSSVTPTIVTDSTDDPDYHVASVPYPGTLPDGKKARFYRVKVVAVP